MALTISQVGSNNSTASSATLAVTAVTAAVGDWLVVMVAADNAGTSGAASLTSVTDSAGNSYTMTRSNYDPGSASAGVTFGLFRSKLTATLTGGTVTANFSPNTTAKAMVVYSIAPGANEVVAFDRVGAGYTGTTKVSPPPPSPTATRFLREWRWRLTLPSRRTPTPRTAPGPVNTRRLATPGPAAPRCASAASTKP